MGILRVRAASGPRGIGGRRRSFGCPEYLAREALPQYLYDESALHVRKHARNIDERGWYLLDPGKRFLASRAYGVSPAGGVAPGR
jgi:hypothetical protein